MRPFPCLGSSPKSRIIGKKAAGEDIHVPDVVGLRDRVIIAAMVNTFARVRAMVAMTVEGYYVQGNDLGCGSTIKAASSTKCPRIIPWRSTRRVPEGCLHRSRQERSALSHGAGDQFRVDQQLDGDRRPLADDPPTDQADRHPHRGGMQQLRRRGSPATWKPRALWKRPNRWPPTHPRGRPSFTTGPMTR